jgi:hypothetical protein
MTLDNLMKGLMQSANQPQGQAEGSDPLSQALGGLTGGGSPGNNQGDQMLGALEGIIGGRPGTGKPLPRNASNASNPGQAGGGAVMSVVQPIADRVAEKVGISPQVATVVSSIALHYLLASHPSTSAKAPMDFGSTMQELKSGGLQPDTLRNSGMLNDVTQATGLDQNKALRSLNTAFGTLASHV